ncbi:hypothetical protein PsorP6_006931 [Peronosclerospora sorghi]|uniref:Uncharacterized protein n=1 Tax=Peronosclerospora sorghi TaxID=230839 RepID=A0ACC0WAE8_9STRA|nr:hypothetical protein PsorP6_006931 [Peronosclerospora sorghi]
MIATIGISKLFGHGPVDDPAVYATNRVLQAEHDLELTRIAKDGETPRVILATLHQADPKCLLVGKDIYNTKQKASNSLLNGRQPIEVLLDCFRQESIYHAFRRSASGRLLSLFFAPNTGISLAAEFSANLKRVRTITHGRCFSLMIASNC